METPPPDYLLPNPKLRLREQLREVARFRHLSLRTEQTYWDWMRRFILFHGKKHPREMGEAEGTNQSLLTSSPTRGKLSANHAN